MRELQLLRTLRPGSRGGQVSLIQEWLTLNGHHTVVDGDFGPATACAVKDFQRRRGLRDDGAVGPETFDRLLLPMRRALSPIEPGRRRLPSLLLAHARQHLREHPREVGGQNCGPWVRLYMRGRQGRNWPWCAGFVSFLLERTCEALGRPPPIESSFSCDHLAADAKARGLFLSERRVAAGTAIPRGALFLVRRTPTDWAHVGIVVRPLADAIETIEGNTNDSGDREGYEVCKRTRGLKKKDYVVWPE